MVLRCKYCKKEGGKEATSHGRTLHGFPLEDPALVDIWKRQLKLHPSFIPNKYSKICSDHFPSECFRVIQKRRTLTAGSIPTLFSDLKNRCFYCNETKDSRPGLSLRKFPLEKPELLKKWLLAIDIKNFVPCKDSLICTDHFNQSCFRKIKNRTFLNLKDDAVPSIFLKETLEHAQEPTQKPGEPTQEPAYLYAIDTETETDLREEISDYNDLERDFSNNNENVNPNTQDTIEEGRKIVNHDHRYALSPKSSKRKLSLIEKKFQKCKFQNKVQKRHIRRLNIKVDSLKSIARELRKRNSVPESGLSCLDSIASSDVGELFTRFLKNKENVGDEECINSKKKFKGSKSKNGLGICREKYPPALRCFSMTLHFYSPKAYNFVRQKFCRALPDPSTLRSWYSSVDGEPGFTTESFEALKIKVSEASEGGKQVICSLMLDEISIKSGLQNVSVGKVRGYVDFGTEMEVSDEMPLAKDALVIMVVALDGSWKLPIAYFLVHGIDSTTNAELINISLRKLHEVGVEVVSVTLDGPSKHFATMRLLGAKLDINDCHPYFPHPSTQGNIYVIFDACHMLKLMRNCLGEYKILKDGDGNPIEWRYIEALIKIQENEGLRAGNKLRLAHLKYHKLKMKVFLAAQTLSSSVADSIEFCNKVLKLKEFEGSESTCRFLRCVDRIFDFLNSRNPFGKGYKAPLRRNNELFWRPQVLSEIEYLKKISNADGVLMTKTRRQVAFVGLISASLSVMEIFDSHVKRDRSQLNYLLTYKLSQDHLELFFCAVRSCGGWCPNPTAAQFISAYKRLLIHHEVRSANGNVKAMDSTNILCVPSSRPAKLDLYDPAIYDKMLNERVSEKYGLNDVQPFTENGETYVGLPETLSSFSRSCVANIGGWVVKKLVDQKRLVVRCEQCQQALFQKSQKWADFEDNGLIEAKTRGGLVFPSESVVEICFKTENLLRHSLNKINGLVPKENNFQAVLCSKVLTELFQPPCSLFPSLNNHVFDNAVEEPSHVYDLIKNVVCAYIKLRVYSATKLASEAAVGEKVRNHLNRQIIWQRQ